MATSNNYRPFLFRIAGMSLAAVTISCANVTVRKIPTPSQYVHWTDDMQADADRIQGIRFYLPRPFVSVFESFPVRTDIYLATGTVSPDGKYINITNVSGGLGDFVPANFQISSFQVLPATDGGLTPNGSTANPKGTQNAAAGLLSVLKMPVSAVPTTPTPKPEQPLPPNPAKPQTGVNQQKSTNNNAAFAYQPLRGNFDLVYMPDFDEQYAVDSSAGLGNANFEVNLGQGWSLQGYNSLSDNSEINKRILDVIDTSMQLATTAASAELGQFLPAIQSAAKAVGSGANLLSPQAIGTNPSQPQAPNSSVTLKIVVLHYAARGLYPVIKPRELAERATSASDKPTYGIFDLFQKYPHYVYSSDFDPNEIKNAQKDLGTAAQHYTVPRYPYQYISFNMFQYVAIQMVSPDEQPFKTKYPGTGTDNESGSARVGELTGLIQQLQGLSVSTNNSNTNEKPTNPTPNKLSDDQQKQITDFLAKNSIPDKNSPCRYSLTGLSMDTWNISGGLVITGGHPSGITESDARVKFEKMIQDQINGMPGLKDVKITLSFSNRPADLGALEKFYTAMKDQTKVAYPSAQHAENTVDDAWLETLADPKQPTDTPDKKPSYTGKLTVKFSKQPPPSDDDLKTWVSAVQTVLNMQFGDTVKLSAPGGKAIVNAKN